jgi:hypothetical protein
MCGQISTGTSRRADAAQNGLEWRPSAPCRAGGASVDQDGEITNEAATRLGRQRGIAFDTFKRPCRRTVAKYRGVECAATRAFNRGLSVGVPRLTQFALQPALRDLRSHRVRFVVIQTSESAPTTARWKRKHHRPATDRAMPGCALSHGFKSAPVELSAQYQRLRHTYIATVEIGEQNRADAADALRTEKENGRQHD